MITILIICLIRTWLFKPKKKASKIVKEVDIDQEKAVCNLQTLIKCKTVSHVDKKLEDEAEFQKLKDSLKALFPNVYKKMSYEELGPRELLFHLKGKSNDPKHASIFMAHFDVVDVIKENWKEDPFAGVRKDGELWGRGTIDTKGTLNGTLTAMDQLLSEGFVPQNDIYFAFAGDEEIQGGSAKLAVEYFKKNGIDPLLVIDEGGGLVNGIFPGVGKDTACIGTAEKGALSLTFHLDGEGGHASSPAQHTPVGKLAILACDIENHPFKFKITKPVKEMFDVIGRESNFTYRFIFANLWLFSPILDRMTRKSGGTLNALMRSTCALTMMQGAPVTNVIPSEASLGLNMRLLPGDDCQEAKARLEGFAKKENINVTTSTEYIWNASRVSTTNCDGFHKVEEAVSATWGEDTIVSPFIMMACSDSRFYGEISDKVYRFSAVRLRADQMNMIHGDNERLSDQQIKEQVTFFYRLESKC